MQDNGKVLLYMMTVITLPTWLDWTNCCNAILIWISPCFWIEWYDHNDLVWMSPLISSRMGPLFMTSLPQRSPMNCSVSITVAAIWSDYLHTEKITSTAIFNSIIVIFNYRETCVSSFLEKFVFYIRQGTVILASLVRVWASKDNTL